MVIVGLMALGVVVGLLWRIADSISEIEEAIKLGNSMKAKELGLPDPYEEEE